MTEFLKLRTAEEAWEVFLAEFSPKVVTETSPVVSALDRVLAEEIRAPQSLPTFIRSTVDGYAVIAADTHGASQGLPAYLDVVAEVPMGESVDFVLHPGQAVMVHTGGMIPEGADAVVMLENTGRTETALMGSAPLQAGFSTYGIEVHRPAAAGEACIQPGEDIREGRTCVGCRAYASPAGHRGVARAGHHRS